MSDSNENLDDDLNFEPSADGDDLDFQLLEPGQEPPAEPAAEDPLKGKKVLTDEEYQALLQKQDSTSTLADSLGKLTQTLSAPAQPAAAPAPQGPAPLTDEELEKLLFQPGQSATTIRQIVARELGQMQGMNIQQQQQTNKRLLKLDPKTSTLYTKYEADIERRVQALPPQVRYRPDIYEAVYKEVIVERQEEIIQERAAEIAKNAVEEALKKAGIGGEASSAAGGMKPPALHQEGSGSAPPKPKKTMYLTAEDAATMREMMMDPKDPDQRRAYYERFMKGRKK